MNKLIVLALLAYIAIGNVNAQEVKITLGMGTPIFNADIYSSNGKIWSTGDAVGSLIITIPTNYVDLSVWHHSLIPDLYDFGVTGFSISKTFTFNL